MRLLYVHRVFFLIVAGVTTGALAGCEKPVSNSPEPKGHSVSVSVTGASVVDSARNRAIADSIAATMVATAAPPPVEVLDLNEDAVGNPLDLITATIDTNVTLGSWLKSHPADQVSMVAPIGNTIDDTFCRAAVVNTRLGNRPFVRSALFYIPGLPNDERLPRDTASVAASCELRAMVLVSAESDIATSRGMLESVTQALEKRLGPRVPGDAIMNGGIRGSDGGRVWREEAKSVLVATAPVGRPPIQGEVEDTAAATAAKLFVVAYAPGSGAEDFNSWEARYESRHGAGREDRQLRYRYVDSAAVWAGMPAVATDLKTVIAYLVARDENDGKERRPSSVDIGLLRALRAIHQAAPSLPPPRRAAALFAGDIMLDATLNTSSADTNSAIMRAMPSLGITFRKIEGYGYANPRAWLWEAYRLDSTGRAGRAAFVELLGMQWPDDKRDCPGDEYQRVIDHGEAALKRGDDNPLIHYYLGSAYKTIYDLAHFENSEVGNPSAYASQAEPARLKGIEHFRAALESLPDHATRREAWIKAMRMILQRSGEQPEYVCFPD